MTELLKTNRRIPVFLFVGYMLIFLIRNPVLASEELRRSLTLCFRSVIPTLFPYFVLTGLIVNSGMIPRPGKRLSVFSEKVFGMSGNCLFAFFLGALGGFPLGTKILCDLYGRNGISKDEAEALCPYFTLCSPFFAISTSKVLFGSAKAGVTVFLTQTCLTLIMLILTSGSRRKNTALPKEPSETGSTAPFSFSKTVSGAFMSMLSLCGIILFFSCVSASVVSFVERNAFSDGISVLISGIFELTKGVFSLGNVNNAGAKLMLYTFFVSFGGISVIFQCDALMKEKGLSSKRFWTVKPVFALFSTVAAYFLAVFFL